MGGIIAYSNFATAHMDQPRVERIFRLMRLMAGNTYYTDYIKKNF